MFGDEAVALRLVVEAVAGTDLRAIDHGAVQVVDRDAAGGHDFGGDGVAADDDVVLGVELLRLTVYGDRSGMPPRSG